MSVSRTVSAPPRSATGEIRSNVLGGCELYSEDVIGRFVELALKLFPAPLEIPRIAPESYGKPLAREWSRFREHTEVSTVIAVRRVIRKHFVLPTRKP
jgi:hypothetical protein